MKKSFFLFLLIWFIFVPNGKSQVKEPVPLMAKVLKIMAAEGFQSISIRQETNELSLIYENRRYRYEVAAIKKIIQLVVPILQGEVERLNIITLKQQIPILSTTLLVGDYLDFLAGKKDLATFINQLQFSQAIAISNDNEWAVKHKNSGQYSLEIVIEPDLNLVLGGAPDAIRHQFNLIPTANLYLWKGAQFKFQGILPISNEFLIPEETMVRPGILAFSQQVRLPSNLFAGISVGYFSAYRYGTALNLTKYLLDGNLALNAHLGYTGYASYPKRLGVDKPEKVWQYSDIDYIDYTIGVNYFIPKWNLQTSVTYGKALYNKKIVQVGVTQYFRELAFGLFGYKTNDGYNYGVKLAIPMLQKKYWKPKRVSVRPSTHLNYTYFTTQKYISQYETNIYSKFHDQSLNPSLIQSLMVREKWD